MVRTMIWTLVLSLITPCIVRADEDTVDLSLRRTTGTAGIHLHGRIGSTVNWYCDYEGDVNLRILEVEGDSLLVAPGQYELGVNYRFFFDTVEPATIHWYNPYEDWEESEIVAAYTGRKTDDDAMWTANYPEYPSISKCCVAIFWQDYSWEDLLRIVSYTNDGVFFNISAEVWSPPDPTNPFYTLFDPVTGTIELSGQFGTPVPTRRTHWGALKALYR